MCGIVGYLGKNNANKVIINGLKKLEYRGYDSSGVALYNFYESKFDIYKDIVRVNSLERLTEKARFSNCGIGHTRWATHGKVSRENAHPHTSSNGRFIIVHNGIIENSEELYNQYLKDRFLKSETDTEIIALLIDLFSTKLSVNNAIITTLKLLEGSYAILVVDNENPEAIYVAKNRSPIVVGVSDDGIQVVSDTLALTRETENFFALPDKTFAVCDSDNINLFNYESERINIKWDKFDLKFDEVGLGKYSHFMIKEIDEQPKVIKEIIKKYYKNEKIIINPEIVKELKKSDKIHIVAAGTSMHSGLVGKKILEKICGIQCEVHIASEFAYESHLFSSNPYFIFISQSGETADLKSCINVVKKINRPILTITNNRSSLLARESKYFLDIIAGPEIAVASTKAYTAQIAMLFLLACSIASKHKFAFEELNKVIISMENFLKNNNINEISSKYLQKRNCFFIGKGISFDLSLEAALKLKEVTYIQTEGFAAGELKHGTIALIEKDTPVFGFISEKNKNKLTRSSIKEVEARGAKTMIFSLKSLAEKNDMVLDDVYYLLSPIVLVLPAQLLSYYTALQRGYDVDKPRNLAKSVTVE